HTGPREMASRTPTAPRQSQARQPSQCKLAEEERNENTHYSSISWIKLLVNANFIAMEPGEQRGIAHPLPESTDQSSCHHLLRSTAQNP
ncbi:MAG: hypothetical protein WAJ82_14235, partial [Azonexus sp.]